MIRNLKTGLESLLELQKTKSRFEAVQELIKISGVQEFAIQANTDATNLVLSFNKEKNEPITVIGAHYDVYPGSLGMNDNGVAVVAIIKIAQFLTRIKCQKRVDLVLFDREETGMLGSDLYIRSVGPENIDKALILDIIAYGDTILGSYSRDFVGQPCNSAIHCLAYALPSDNAVFTRYYVPNVLFTAGHNCDIKPHFNSSRGRFEYTLKYEALFYASFHNRRYDNRIDILNFDIAKAIYKVALEEAIDSFELMSQKQFLEAFGPLDFTALTTAVHPATNDSEDAGIEPRREDLTCHSCDIKTTCPYAYDLYNTDGDCLAAK